MRSERSDILGFALAVLVAAPIAAPAFAQTGGGYDLSRFAIGGLAGVSHGGGWSLAGTLSPPEAGTATGGGFALLGGWGGMLATASVPGGGPSLPRAFAMLPARPNPFRHATAIGFDLPNDAWTQLDVYDVGGQRVRALAGGPIAAGRHLVEWDGADDGGRRLADGVYFVRIEAGAFHASSRVVLLH